MRPACVRLPSLAVHDQVGWLFQVAVVAVNYIMLILQEAERDEMAEWGASKNNAKARGGGYLGANNFSPELCIQSQCPVPLINRQSCPIKGWKLHEDSEATAALPTSQATPSRSDSQHHPKGASGVFLV